MAQGRLRTYLTTLTVNRSENRSNTTAADNLHFFCRLQPEIWNLFVTVSEISQQSRVYTGPLSEYHHISRESSAKVARRMIRLQPNKIAAECVFEIQRRYRDCNGG